LGPAEKQEYTQILVGKSEEKRPQGRLWHRWEDNFGMTLREMERDGVEWMHLIQIGNHFLALMNMVINLRIP
jgi:hypothetical protein